MKKIITTVMALTLAFGMTVTAFGAPSPSKDGAVPVEAFLAGEGIMDETAEKADAILKDNPVTMTVRADLASSVSDAITAQKAQIVEAINRYNMGFSTSEVKEDDELTVLTVCDVIVPDELKALMKEDDGACLWVKFPVQGIAQGASVGALYYLDGEWTPTDAFCIEDGFVRVACGDFSPIAIIGITPSTQPVTPTQPTVTVQVTASLDGKKETVEKAEAILKDNPVTVAAKTELESSASAAITAQKAEIVKAINLYSSTDVKEDDELTVLTVCDVTVPDELKALLKEDASAYLWVKIPVKGIVKGASVGALHYADGKWTPIEAVCKEDGFVSVKSRDFSPIAIVGIAKPATPASGWTDQSRKEVWDQIRAAQAGTTSPKTGEAGVAGFVLIAAACGAALVFTKKKFA